LLKSVDRAPKTQYFLSTICVLAQTKIYLKPMKPLHDNIIVKAIAEERTVSGIIIPETVEKGRPERGEVVAIGPGKLLENGQRAPVSVQVGDHVVFKKYGPDEVKVGGETLLILSEHDILAIL
jgi:chaperonin GroES